MLIDARIPVLIGSGAVAERAVLIEGAPVPAGVAGARFDLTSSHAPNCSCCTSRSPVAEALASLFTRRARGEVAFFRAVQAVGLSDAGRAALMDALANDPVASARFRIG